MKDLELHVLIPVSRVAEAEAVTSQVMRGQGEGPYFTIPIEDENENLVYYAASGPFPRRKVEQLKAAFAADKQGGGTGIYVQSVEASTGVERWNDEVGEVNDRTPLAESRGSRRFNAFLHSKLPNHRIRRTEET